MRSAGSAIKDCTRRERGARQRRGAGIVLNLFQLAPDRFIHEPAGLDRDHPRAISGADVGFQIGSILMLLHLREERRMLLWPTEGAINIGSASP